MTKAAGFFEPHLLPKETCRFRPRRGSCGSYDALPAERGFKVVERNHTCIFGSRQRKLMERAAERGIIGNVLAPNRRVAALDAFIRSRARELAAIQEVDHGSLAEALDSAMSSRATFDDGAYRLCAG